MDGTASAVMQDPGAQSQSIVVSQEGGADGAGEEAGSQQVFYVTEDGALLDPQSLGLSLEQLQQLLNQA
ncbi:hypothetical protein Ocin01_03453 [Orchesella cincta]|uniref:Uncharacterized protein n=1 Tax=Orchesella cincta TaxID=48709 RepID=A0A1D2ND84_ORCCI|nr:hypothetical protein Ocin01_03453 [Orchesella cincta]